MKKSIVFYLIFLLVACNTTTTNQTPEGIYVCRFEHEFAKVEDTLVLQKLNDNFYKIIRHSGVINKSNNKKQMIAEVWKLEFEESKNAFTEMKTGRIIIWDADKHKLVFGNRDYVRK